MKKKKTLKKSGQFYNNVSDKRKGRQEMRLQTDQEFQQNVWRSWIQNLTLRYSAQGLW